VHCGIGSGVVCFGSGGSCICAGGALCVVRALDWWFVLALCLSLAFDRLLEFLFIRFFSFLFLLGYFLCVLSMHSSRRRLRTMCDSRTGGWSLPGVMSD
jgi:hypothetical protein